MLVLMTVTQDFPIDTQFAQIGLLRNPTIKVLRRSSLRTHSQLPILSRFYHSDGGVEVGDNHPRPLQGLLEVMSFHSTKRLVFLSTSRIVHYTSTQSHITTQDYLVSQLSGNKIPFESNTKYITTVNGFSASIDTNFQWFY